MGLQPRKEPKPPSDIFVDRNDPRETFKIELDKVSAEPAQCHLLFFYGVGGVGKSVLLKRIEKELKDDAIPDSIIGKRDDVVGIRYDLKNNCRSIDVINNLSSALKEQGIMLPRISVAREMLLKYGIQPDKKDRISDNTFWKIVSGVFKIPYSSLIEMAADTGYKKLKEWSVESKDYSISEDFKAIRNMDAETLMKNYAWCFKRDLRYAIKALREEKKSLVFLIDTYETISDSAPGETGYADRWLEDIVLSEWTTGMLWCMAGRDMLSWSVLENERGIQFEMEEFKPEDACLYLENRAGIRKDELKAFLIKLTHCLPVYLDLCAVEFSGFSSQKKRELNTFPFTEVEYQEIFGRDREELIIRFRQSISDETRDLANELSAFGVWTREMAKELIHNFSDTRYEAFVRHSFIDKDKVSGLRTYHEVIRETFEHAFQKEHPEAYKEALLKFVNYCIHHPDSPVITQKTINRLVEFYETGFLASEDQTRLVKMLMFVIKKKAVSVYVEYDWCKRMFRSTPDTAEDYLAIANEYLSSCDDAGYYQEMNGEALMIPKKYQLGYTPASFSFLVLLSVSFSNLGNYKESLQITQKCYEHRLKQLGENHPDTLIALGNLAEDYWNIGDRQKGLKLSQRCYAMMKETLGENHPNTLKALDNLAANYLGIEDFENGLDLSQFCYNKRKELLGEDHPDTLKALGNLAAGYWHISNYRKSLELFQTCYKKGKEYLGENHPYTLKSMHNLATAYFSTGDYKKGIELGQLCYKKRKEVLGKNHPDTLSSHVWINS